MLGGHGQRLRLATRGSGEGGDTGKIGVDFTGEGGAVVWDGSGWGNMTSLKKNETLVTGIRWARNGAVVGIEGVLEPPRSIGEPRHCQKLTNRRYLTDTSFSDISITTSQRLVTSATPTPGRLVRNTPPDCLCAFG